MQQVFQCGLSHHSKFINPVSQLPKKAYFKNMLTISYKLFENLINCLNRLIKKFPKENICINFAGRVSSTIFSCFQGNKEAFDGHPDLIMESYKAGTFRKFVDAMHICKTLPTAQRVSERLPTSVFQKTFASVNVRENLILKSLTPGNK